VVPDRTAGNRPDEAWPSDLAARLSHPPPRSVPDSECDLRAAVCLILSERPGRAPGDDPADYEPDTSVAAATNIGEAASCLDALFVIRARVEGDPWSGHVALPGGRAEPDDADLAATALRETREETGIALPPAALLGRLNELHPRSAHLPSIAVTPFVAWAPERPPVRQSAEISGHIWIPLPVLADPRHRGTLRREAPAPRTFPTVEYAGAVVWGLTFAIVDDFLRRLGAHVPGPPAGGRPAREPGDV
jgi:8-oxo-dGTP pyrophosphatase MutT (NUDIX family)